MVVTKIPDSFMKYVDVLASIVEEREQLEIDNRRIEASFAARGNRLEQSPDWAGPRNLPWARLWLLLRHRENHALFGLVTSHQAREGDPVVNGLISLGIVLTDFVGVSYDIVDQFVMWGAKDQRTRAELVRLVAEGGTPLHPRFPSYGLTVDGFARLIQLSNQQTAALADVVKRNSSVLIMEPLTVA